MQALGMYLSTKVAKFTHWRPIDWLLGWSPAFLVLPTPHAPMHLCFFYRKLEVFDHVSHHLPFTLLPRIVIFTATSNCITPPIPASTASGFQRGTGRGVIVQTHIDFVIVDAEEVRRIVTTKKTRKISTSSPFAVGSTYRHSGRGRYPSMGEQLI
ncbi:hypothetical protein BDD12DRAFT_99435 [Trichophaea hybrida]|nr:hypothetical protein BDD12DRAFT_99435 [Trichophaea hybrida]